MLSDKEIEDGQWFVGLCYGTKSTPVQRAAQKPLILEAIEKRMAHRSAEWKATVVATINHLF